MAIISPILGNSQKLDGGSMFGNVPKAMWQKWVDVDEQNRVQLATRAMLIQEEGRNVLLETGIGAFFEPKFKDRYGVVESEHVLLDSLKKHNLSHEDIDIVILSHLHFDHAGGLLSAYEVGKEHELLFSNAQYIVSQKAWHRALRPHPRDKASFIPELVKLLSESDRLLLQTEQTSSLLGPNYRFHYSDGHTPGLLMTEVNFGEDMHYLFVSDLIPAHQWVHLPVTMGYDRYPELLIEEKQQVLDYVIEHKCQLFFTHDLEIISKYIERIKPEKYNIIK